VATAVVPATTLAGQVTPPTPSEPAPGREPLVIRHKPMRCLLAERFPLVDACFEPGARVAQARVYFQADGTKQWHWVDMQPLGPCHRAALPRPAPEAHRVRYVVAATDVDAAQSGTPEMVATVVTDEKACGKAPVAPFLSNATVVVGGGGAPQWFMLPGAGRALGGKAIAGIVGGGAVVAGGALALGGGGSSAPGGGTGGTSETTFEPVPTTSSTLAAPPTTTTTTAPGQPSPTTTTTTTLPAGPSPTTTTTTTLPTPATTTTTTTTTTPGTACASDRDKPTVKIESPRKNADVGATVPIVVTAEDRGGTPSGLATVRLTARETTGTRNVTIATFTGSGPRFEITWAVPACATPRDRWEIRAEATDVCGNAASDTARVDRTASSCGTGEAAARAPAGEPGLVWTSELALAGGRGQVVVNGTDGQFPGAGRTDIVVAARAGTSTVEATVVDARGTPGAWRFTLAAGAIRPGTLRVVAGGVAAAGPQMLVFRLQGRPGERVVFSYEAP
jgi:hypothetical protein